MNKYKLKGCLLIMIPCFIIQLMMYYGNYLEVEDWNLVFQENFQNIPYALGTHLPIVIGIIICIIKYRKR